MQETRITLASLKSLLVDPWRNVERVREVCEVAAEENARMLFLPELMLTGHAGHPKMAENAEPVPDGPLCREMLSLSSKHGICICVGLAELDRQIVYNSMIVVDRGEYLGLQRKVHLSNDEYLSFGAGERMAIFDIGDVRFGMIICYDNHFPELALALAMAGVDLILAPHAARTGVWPDPVTAEFAAEKVKQQQDGWEKVHRARAYDHNVYVLLNNAVGSSMDGLQEDAAYASHQVTGVDARKVVANHAGTVMAIDPGGDVFLRTGVQTIEEEIVTVTLDPRKRKINHGPARNRRPATTLRILRDCAEGV
jgi:predicted amidohydrolase